MEDIEYTYTLGMDDAELDRRLRENDTGVLSLAHDADAYAVPISYHYDGESLYLRLSDEPDSEKMDFVEATEEATFLLYERAGDRDSWSVLARGRLRELDQAEMERFDAAEVNADFTPLRVFDEAIDEVDLLVYEFVVESMTGRKTGEQ